MIVISTEVTNDRLADLMITAIECNDMTTQWCHGVYLESPDIHPRRDGAKTPWYDSPDLYADPDFHIAVHEISNERTGEITIKQVRHKDLIEGLQLMATKYPKHFADFMQENEDAVTADIFLQCIALKDVIYG